jgi:hypothetical protein
VKGTAKVKVGDESDSGHNTKETSPVPPDDADNGEMTNTDAQESHEITPGSHSKSGGSTGSVGDTPVVAVTIECRKDGVQPPVVINGEVKTGKTPLVSINQPQAQSVYNETDTAVSPRAQSQDTLGPKLTYAQMAQKKKEAKEREAALAAAKAANDATVTTTADGRPEQNKAKEIKHPQGCKGDEGKKDTSSVITSDSHSHDRDVKQRLVKTSSQPGADRPGIDGSRHNDSSRDRDRLATTNSEKTKGRGTKRLERTDSGPAVQSQSQSK